MSKDLMKLTAVELGKKIKDKEVTVVEATKACLERIKASPCRVRGWHPRKSLNRRNQYPAAVIRDNQGKIGYNMCV